MGIRSYLTSAALVAGTAAQFASYATSDHSLSVRIPESTASSKDGPIYFQITAPSGTRWAAFGQGTGMSGAQVFIIYAASSSEVTLSPRLSSGYRQPTYSDSINATLLSGSGINGQGVMVANVRCDNCLSWDGGSMNPTDGASNWIYAYQTGDAINSNDPEATISKHSSRGEFVLDLTTAAGADSQNPFVTTGDNPSSTGSGTAPTSTGAGSGNGAVSTPVTNNNSANRGSSSADAPASTRTIYNNPFAHGVLMSVLFVGLLPLVSLTLYLPLKQKVRYVHGPLQLVNVIILIIGMSLGIVYGRQINEVGGYHQIIGYIVVALMVLFQPAMGVYQHLNYRKNGTRTSVGIGHRWLGYVLIALGIINGGLGWNLTETTSAYVPYGVLAGIMFLFYVAVVLLSTLRSKRQPVPPPTKTEARAGSSES